MPDDTIRVFLVDDHELVLRGLRGLLDGAGDMTVVGTAGSAEEAAELIPHVRPDVAVLDVRLPDGSGVDVCRSLRETLPGVAVLMLTSYDDDQALLASTLAGASGYVLKEVGADRLVESVRRVAAGESLIEPSLTRRVVDRLARRDREAERLAALTERETTVLTLIAEGLTNRQIGERLHVSESTVKKYVTSLLAKLGIDRRTQAAVIAAQLLH